jgi:protein TonB
MDLSYNSSESSSRRLGGFLVVVALHVGIGYALVNGLARKIVEVIKPPIETKIVEDVKPPPPDQPPPPPPKLAPPPPAYIPPVEVNIQVPLTSNQNAITSVTSKPQVAPVQRVATGIRLPPVIDAARSCQQPEYPAASRRNEETGTVQLRFLIGIDGKVIDSKVESSSGYPRLDQAAIRALSQCQFKAGTLDGKPEQSWASLKYVWQLQ